MLSIEAVKKILGKQIPDKEAEEIRDGFRALSEVIFETWLKEKQLKDNNNANSKLSNS